MSRGFLAARSITLGAVTLFALVAAGCTVTREWWTAHRDGGAWVRAAQPFNPQHATAMALLLAYPLVERNDDRWSRTLARRRPVGGEDGTDHGDLAVSLLVGAPFLASGWAALAPAHVGEGREVFEVALEASVVSGLLSLGLKPIVRKERPNDNSNRGGRLRPSKAGFPSGHVMAATTGAVITSRWLRTKGKGWIAVEALLYGAVAFTAYTRIENDKHFPSDTLASAALAAYISNTIWDAHFGRPGEPGIYSHLREHLTPVYLEGGYGVVLRYEF